jgi:hypothetical protein
MANRLYLQVSGSNKIFDFPVMEDITYETTSKFTSFMEFSSWMDMGTKVVNTIGAATGRIGTTLGGLRNVMDVPRWQGTDPVKVTMDLMFYTQTDPKKDVHDKMKYITSLNILTREGGEYIVPGVNAKTSAMLAAYGSNMKATKSLYLKSKEIGPKLSKSETYDYNSKIVSLEIPGVLYLTHAFIVACQPTVSRQKTESGYPLWGKLNVQFSGVFPANTQMFDDVETAVKLETAYNLGNRI